MAVDQGPLKIEAAVGVIAGKVMEPTPVSQWLLKDDHRALPLADSSGPCSASTFAYNRMAANLLTQF